MDTTFMSALFFNPSIVTPAAAGDLILDLSADSLSGADASAVSSWADLTGTYTAVQATGAKQPTLRTTGGPNGGKAVEFNGTSNCMTVASFAMSSWSTVLVVCKKLAASTAVQGYLMEHGANIGANPGFLISETGSPGIQMKRAAGSIAANEMACWTGLGEWVIAGVQCGPTIAASVNGVVVGASTYGQSPYAKGSLTDTLNIGAQNNGVAAWTNQRFARILIFNRYLSAATLQKVVTGLAQTYGIAI